MPATTRPSRLGLSLLVVALALLAGACGGSDARRVRWNPTETFPARAAIDARWEVADAVVGRAVDEGTIVGAEVLVVTPDGWSARGYGWATASRRPDEVTVFELGSISKVFTGTLLADMALRGEVALLEPARDLLPGRLRMPPSSRPITLLDLATHMSGMPRLPPNMKRANKKDPYADFDVDDLWAALEQTRLEREPGVAKEYSNYAVGLLGQLLVHRADADGYLELLDERVLGPLGMTDTAVELSSEQEARFAWAHDKHKVRTSPWAIPALAGAGGLRSTARDMARFVQGYLRADSPIAAAAQVALTPRNIPGEGKWDQGLGWVVARDRSVAWHNGATGGFHTWLGLDLEGRLGVLVLCNTQRGEVDEWGMKILRRLGRELGGQPVADDARDEAARIAASTGLEVPQEVASR
jgi:CubicO group peptidase (beta-lactamase class C family)